MSKSAEDLDREKQLAAEAAMPLVRSGMTLGLGTGSTAVKFVRLVGERVRAGTLSLRAVATSRSTHQLATECGIEVVEPRRGLRLDLTVDGADEIGPGLALTKGGGGALLREKVVARASERVVIVADSSKRVARLGAFPLPVEVVPFALPWVLDALERLGAEVSVRPDRSDPARSFATDQGNGIVDCRFGSIADPLALEGQLGRIAGIVEHGLFVGIADTALVADGSVIEQIDASP